MTLIGADASRTTREENVKRASGTDAMHKEQLTRKKPELLPSRGEKLTLST